MFEFLVSKKTFILAFIGAVLIFLKQMGIDIPDWAVQLTGFGTAAALRHGMMTEAAKLTASVDAVKTR